MHVDSSKTTRNGKTYHRHLLRESYREAGKVKHRTIANLSRCSNEEIEAIRLALRHKGDLEALVKQRPALVLRQGLAVGALWTLFDMARQLGIERALGDTRQGRLALWQVIARVIHQGSRLSAVRLAGVHAACDVLGLDAFNEEDLYGNLDWLCEHQEAIEKHLSHGRAGNDGLFLYDVTSSSIWRERRMKSGHSAITVTANGARYSSPSACFATARDIRFPSRCSRATREPSVGGSARWHNVLSAQLEIRPIHVRLATLTRGHALAVMLAYHIARELSPRWASFDIRVQKGLDDLAGLCVTEIVEKGRARCRQIPEPRESSRKLLEAANIRLSKALACREVVVSTKKRLPERCSQN